jgi:nucleoside-diphosphate-sugar epimerase
MTVLLTGSTGFVGAHILDELIGKGYSVVATVRSIAKAKEFQDKYPKLVLEEVPDITAASAYDHVFAAHKDISKVIHVASPYRYDITDPKKELIEPAVNGTLTILNSVRKFNEDGKVDRVAITSSFAAVFGSSDATITENTWNPITLEQGYEGPRPGYYASKTFAEKFAWEFVEKNKPNFEITTICLPMVFGPQINPVTYDSVNTTLQHFTKLIDSKSDEVPASGIPLYVDVRDGAKAHILAIERDESANKRWLITAGYYTNQDFVDVARKKLPQYANRLPKGIPGNGAKEK